ncbi:DUF3667 domain-containing protein [Dokdonia sp. Hel_I_53]|uniref:DUF3667 domain-containing protein n=1 Tax=Dokdonia sp. Hel_I_53 TaxID=1566287 RepID=UPI00119C2EFC|nr:DUF3667 domain-containing protein [Dokdonia sp. Hel_I_53]TVZ50967.1 uncharacterized protein DUF3667 [Dokdonia sp. Hel_I_53]
MSQELKEDSSEKQFSKKKTERRLVVSNQCKNCGHHLFLDQQYCPVCGAKRIHNRITARNLLEDFTERFLNIENVFLKTFISLFTKPENVIDGYVDGLRKRYMSAFSYFAVALTISSFYYFIFRNWFVGPENLGLFSAGLADGANVEDAEFGLKIINFIFDYQSILSFLNIPFYAIISKLVFWNYKKYNFVEHLVIYLYTYSQFQIISSLLGTLFIWSQYGQIIIGILSGIGPIVYTAYVLCRIFNLTLESIIIKTLLFLVIALPVSCLFFSVIGGVLYSFGLFDTLIQNVLENVEAGKAAKEASQVVKDSLPKDTLLKNVQTLRDSIAQ